MKHFRVGADVFNLLAKITPGEPGANARSVLTVYPQVTALGNAYGADET